MNRASGAVVARYAYGAYGELGTGSASGFPFRFTGQKLDPATGLYRYKARWYDADVGRFLQTDPIGYKDVLTMADRRNNLSAQVEVTNASGSCSVTRSNLSRISVPNVTFTVTALNDNASAPGVPASLTVTPP